MAESRAGLWCISASIRAGYSRQLDLVNSTRQTPKKYSGNAFCARSFQDIFTAVPWSWRDFTPLMHTRTNESNSKHGTACAQPSRWQYGWSTHSEIGLILRVHVPTAICFQAYPWSKRTSYRTAELPNSTEAHRSELRHHAPTGVSFSRCWLRGRCSLSFGWLSLGAGSWEQQEMFKPAQHTMRSRPP